MNKLRHLRPMSLTVRVLLAVAAAIGLSLLLNAILVLMSIKHHFVVQDLAELRAITRSIAEVLNESRSDQAGLADDLSRAVSGHHGVFYQIERSDGQLVYRTEGGDFAAAAASFLPSDAIDQENLRVWSRADESYRGVITTLSQGSTSYRITAAIDMNFHLQFLRGFRRSLWLIMLGTGMLTLLATWLGIHRGHLPLRGLSSRMREVRANRLHLRIDPDTVPGELQELVVSFNAMIGRLEEGFKRLSHFSSDIAHELRTPLTNLITQTQVTLGKPRASDAYRELLYSSLEEQERLAKMIGDMLWLAKSDNRQIKPDLAPVDLVREFHELFDFFGALAAERDIEFSLVGAAPGVQGDRALLRRAFSNLMSNALRYSPAGTTVAVELLESTPDRVSIAVTNTGQTIASEHLSRLFDRFYRVDPSRQRDGEGAGLGLAITHSIIEAHGGEITAQSGHGSTTFTVLLPVTQTGPGTLEDPG